ncbi:MAG TPA: hypothetical protein VGE84_11320, partial [Allosphingosinicella sp.]
MIRVPFLRLAPLTFVLAVAACSEPTPDGAASPGNGASAEPSAMNPAAATSLTAIPEPFRGRWDASAAACAGKASEMRLVVGPDSLRFHESLGRVEAMRASGADTIALDLVFEGEGKQWRETRALRL